VHTPSSDLRVFTWRVIARDFAYNQAPLELTRPTLGPDKAGATAETKLLGDLKKLSQ
jgi:hypothetical protein